MKPLEIISSIPPWSKADPEAILDSPAFAMPCQIGDKVDVLHRAQVDPAASAMLALSVSFGDEPHTLCLSRSSAFAELDKVWDGRADVPEALLLALVERECGPLFQFLENAVRKQMRLVGIAAESVDGSRSDMLSFQVGDIVFSVTRSASVLSAFGLLRNLDLSHESIREQRLSAEIEYASFVLSGEDIASLTPGDALLLPEIDTVSPRIFVAKRFVVDANGVAPYAADSLVHVLALGDDSIALGKVFDAVETPSPPPSATIGAQLRIVRDGRLVASGRLDRLAGQLAFFVEQTN